MHDGDFKPQGSAARSKGHQSSDIFLSAFVALLIVTAFAALLLHAGLWAWLKPSKRSAYLDRANRPPYEDRHDEPRLQVSPEFDLRSFRTNEKRLLNSYSWVDRTAGIARIPISQAIDQVIANGLPNWNSSHQPVSPLELQRARVEGGVK